MPHQHYESTSTSASGVPMNYLQGTHVSDYGAATGSAGRSYRVVVNSPAHRFDYAVLKRVMDVFLVLLFAPVILVIAGIVALLVMLTSPGPVFFSHRRIRRGGVFFSMLKFRTMCENSAEVLERHLSQHPEDRDEWNRTHKLMNDPRVTPVGRFLRKSSLDELPQIWNVLTGRMTLVGPRPIVAAEVQKYGDQFVYYTVVKPGITGLWQATGRSNLSYEARVALDRHYVENWSLWLDMKLLLLTLKSVLTSRGAV